MQNNTIDTKNPGGNSESASAAPKTNESKKPSTKWAMPTEKGSMLNGMLNGGFTPDDIINVGAIVTKLSDEKIPVMNHLRAKLSSAGRALLFNGIEPATDMEKLKQDLSEQLNLTIGDGPLYNSEVFTDIKLRKATKKLLKKDPTGAELVKLNRLLLEDLFDVNLARRPGRGKSLVQQPATVHYLKTSKKWAVLVTLVKPHNLEGKIRFGRQKFQRQTQKAAIELCAEINNQLLDIKMARALTQHEIELAQKLFWEELEPKHPDWIEYLDKLVEHAEKTDFRPEDREIPTIMEAAKIFWKECVSKLSEDTMDNYRSTFGYVLPIFGADKANQFTDKRILIFANSDESLKYLSSSVPLKQTESGIPLWDVIKDSNVKRPFTHEMQNTVLSCSRRFKNWMHDSKDPKTQENRNWSARSNIKTPDKSNGGVRKSSVSKEEWNKILAEKCRRNPALTIPQMQALVDVSWVAYEGATADYFVRGAFAGTRVKETQRTPPEAFDSEAATLATPDEAAKTGSGRDTELYDNAIIMVEALREAGLDTPKNLKFSRRKRNTIYVLAGFTCNDPKTRRAAELERERLKKKGIEFHYNWGMRFPQNALRRTALSMHYMLYRNTKVTAQWGGNSPGIFKEYYKRLVTREEAAEYWVILPKWLTLKRKIIVKLPPGHKLHPAMTRDLSTAVNAARIAMKSHLKRVARNLKRSEAGH